MFKHTKKKKTPQPYQLRSMKITFEYTGKTIARSEVITVYWIVILP